MQPNNNGIMPTSNNRIQAGYNGLIVFFGTKDLQATHKFYAEIMGLTLYKDQGICKIYNVDGGGKIGFCTHLKVLSEKHEPIITLVTNDVDIAYVNLTASGLKCQGPPEINPKFNINSFYSKDPNGYTVEVQQFLDEGGIDI